MKLYIIKKLCETREGGLTKLAMEIKMSYTNLHRCIRENKIQAQDLEIIAKILEVPISIFFDDEYASINDNQKQIKRNETNIESEQKRLQELIAEKDKIIKSKDQLIESRDQLIIEKERTIQILMNK